MQKVQAISRPKSCNLPPKPAPRTVGPSERHQNSPPVGDNVGEGASRCPHLRCDIEVGLARPRSSNHSPHNIEAVIPLDGGSRLSLGNHAVIIYAATTALPRIPKYLRVLGCRKRTNGSVGSKARHAATLANTCLDHRSRRRPFRRRALRHCRCARRAHVS